MSDASDQTREGVKRISCPCGGLHEPELVVVLLRDLQWAVRYVGRVEGHEGGLRVVVILDDIYKLLLYRASTNR